MSRDLPLIGVVALVGAGATALMLLALLLAGGPWTSGLGAGAMALGCGLGVAALVRHVRLDPSEPDPPAAELDPRPAVTSTPAKDPDL